MRIGLATVYTPGIHGGAEFLADGLGNALKAAGHSLHYLRIPFHFEPPSVAHDVMRIAKAMDFSAYDGGQIDHLICLKFPAYLIEHPRKSVWLLHQHRSAYDLYGGPYGWPRGRAETDRLRQAIIAADNESLGKVPVYTIAKRVSQRLRQYNGIESTALYHPPANAEEFRCREALPYIFAPSRIEALKRQELLLHALALTDRRVQVIFAGTGSRLAQAQSLASQLGLEDRVRFLGEITREEMIALYAHALAVFFGPLDEDYGYVTLEAMLAGKPVITCRDSGGPLEFVLHDRTGWIADPDPEAIAQAMEEVFSNPGKAKAWGQAGYERYHAMDINWESVVQTLLQQQPLPQNDLARANQAQP